MSLSPPDERLANRAEKVFMSDSSEETFDLYICPGQSAGIKVNGHKLERHLREEGLIDRCLSLLDALFWINNPETYPDQFKGKTVFLWKSSEVKRGRQQVPCLMWDNAQVVMTWRQFIYNWGANDYVAIKPSIASE